MPHSTAISTQVYTTVAPFFVTGFQLVRAFQAMLHWPATKLLCDCLFLYISYNLKSIVGLYYCSRDATLKLEFSGKIDILFTNRNQKCYFKVISNALSNT